MEREREKTDPLLFIPSGRHTPHMSSSSGSGSSKREEREEGKGEEEGEGEVTPPPPKRARVGRERESGSGGDESESEVDLVLHRLSAAFVPEETPGLEAQCALVRDLLERTLTAQSNNACLLVGPRGSGKTMAVRHALRALRRKHAPLGRGFVAVHLSGHLQTDDSQAMREICRQLCVEHNLELVRAQGFAENLRFLLRVLERCKDMSLPVFFVLDEFDLFAGRAKQTLLYNLCDLLQSSLAQIAIVGTTTRLDAYELLEKRIRSRISYRRVLFARPRDAATLEALVRGALSLPGREAHNAEVDRTLADEGVRAELALHHSLGRDARWFRLLLAVAVGAASGVRLRGPDLEAAAALLAPDWRAEAVASLSVLELCLAVSMSHLERRGLASYNFVQVYREYDRFLSGGGAGGGAGGEGVTADVFPRAVCFKAFERLDMLSLTEAVEAAAAETYAAKQYRQVRLRLEPLEVKELVSRRADCPTWLRQWCSRWAAST